MLGRSFNPKSTWLLASLSIFVLRTSALEIEIDNDIIELNGQLIELGGGLLAQNALDAKKTDAQEADAAGEHVLELTDGSQMHGKLLSLGKTELLWQRSDASEPLVFSPSDVRRLVLGKRVGPKDSPSNATLKFPGGDWLTGKVNAFANDRFTVEIGGGPSIEVEKKSVQWMVFAPTPPDAFEGPRGPAGMSGWDPAIPGTWDYADDSLIARQSGAITRKFDVLPERLDIQFTAGDGGNQNRGLTLWIQPEGRTTGYSAGSIYLRFQGNTVSMNSYDGSAMKNQTANFDQENAKQDKISRYRLLFDRKSGNLQIRVNGARAAEWMVGTPKTIPTGGSFTFQPSYWSSDMAWTLSNIKVQPWDGEALPDGDPENAGKDIIKAAPTVRKAGTFEGLNADAVRFSGADVSRKEPVFLRFGHRNAEPAEGAIARVWLSHRGEFDVTGLGFKDGVLKVRTTIAGEMALPLAALHAIEFPHRISVLAEEAAEGGDVLVFKNGDQFKGTLIAAADDQRLKWKPIKGTADVHFENKNLAGVLLAARGKVEPPPAAGAAIRWQNGDWLPGTMISLDATKLTMKTALSDSMEISREGLSALYLGASAEPAVWDGASDRNSWMTGAVAPGYWNANRNEKKDPKKPSPWRYFDGAFTLVQGRAGSSGLNIGRSFDNLPEKCEVSFDISSPSGNPSFVSQLFFDDNKPGVMVQSSGDAAYLYDMSPRAGRAVGNQQQQIDFGDSVETGSRVRRYTFYCERLTGRFAMAVNGKLVGQLKRKGVGDSPKPGKGISIQPQVAGSRVTISNLWVGPWTGALPPAAGKAKATAAGNEGAQVFRGGALAPLQLFGGVAAAAKVLDAKAPDAKVADEKPEPKDEPPLEPAKLDEPPSDSIALVNGDEARGTVLKANAESLFMNGEAGELEIPLKRATVVQFVPSTIPASSGTRFRFAGKGAVTLEKFRFENGKVVCKSAQIGEFEIPVAKLSEIVFSPGGRSPFEGQASGQPQNSDANINNFLIEGGGNIIIRGAIRVR